MKVRLKPPILFLWFYFNDEIEKKVGIEVIRKNKILEESGIEVLLIEEEFGYRSNSDDEILIKGMFSVRLSDSGIDYMSKNKQTKKSRLVQELFLRINNGINGIKYSSICTEYTMETPEDLVEDSSSLAFVDFYIYKDIDDHINFNRDEYSSIRLTRGTFYSATSAFNSEGKHSDSNGWKISGEVALGISKYYRYKKY
jgi:hypothetical protein